MKRLGKGSLAHRAHYCFPDEDGTAIDRASSKELSSSSPPESLRRTSSLLPDGSNDGLGGSVARVGVRVGDDSSFDVVGWEEDSPESEGSDGSSEEGFRGGGETSRAKSSKEDLVPETRRDEERKEHSVRLFSKRRLKAKVGAEMRER